MSHPWTKGQVERMNRTIEDATVQRYHDGSHDPLRAHLPLVVAAYDHARRLETRHGLIPHAFLGRTRTHEPADRLGLDPYHPTPGPDS